MCAVYKYTFIHSFGIQSGDRQFKVANRQFKVAMASSKWRLPVVSGDRQFKVASHQFKVAIASSKWLDIYQVLSLRVYVPVNSKTAHPPRAISGHLTRVKLHTVGNLTQNEVRPVGHLTFLSKHVCQRSEAKGFRNSLIQHVSRVHGSLLLSIPRGFFSVVVVLYSYIVEYAFV